LADNRSGEVIRQQLLALYTGTAGASPWNELWQLRQQFWRAAGASETDARFAVSSPFLASATDEYASANVRVMVVGRETYGWNDDVNRTAFDSVLSSMNACRDFLYQERYASAFWQAARRVSDALNPALSPSSARLAWSNVFRMDERWTTPKAKLAKAMISTPLLRNLLTEEIRILRPHVLWLACGPKGDYVLEQQLNQLSPSEGKAYYRVEAPEYAPVVIRGYHPNGLRFRRKFGDALEFIIDSALNINQTLGDAS
jgi:hypothetical protein